MAHDILIGIIMGEVNLGLNRKQIDQIKANCEVLCWILGHAHNPTFADNLAFLMKQAESYGYQLCDTGEVKLR